MPGLIVPPGTPLIRQLKLYSLVGSRGSTDPRVGQIVTYFDELFTGMEYSIFPEYDKENIIFHKGGTFYMEQNVKFGQLLCRIDGFWSYFRMELNLSYEETQVIIKYMVEKHLKQQVGTPHLDLAKRLWGVEKHLKQQVGTPIYTHNQRKSAVEKHLIQQVGTPWLDARSPTDRGVEKYLKQPVGTPVVVDVATGIMVEKHLKHTDRK